MALPIYVAPRWLPAVPAAVVLVAGLSTAPALGQEVRIGAVDSQRIFAESEVIAGLREDLTSRRDQFQQRIDERESELMAQQEELQQQQDILAEDALAQRQQELQQAGQQFQQEVQRMQRQLEVWQQAAQQQVRTVIDDVASEVAASANVRLVVDTGRVYHVEPHVDLTDRVMAGVEEELADTNLETLLGNSSSGSGALPGGEGGMSGGDGGLEGGLNPTSP